MLICFYYQGFGPIGETGAIHVYVLTATRAKRGNASVTTHPLLTMEQTVLGTRQRNKCAQLWIVTQVGKVEIADYCFHTSVLFQIFF